MTSPALPSTYLHLADLAPVLARRAIELTLAGDTSLMRSILERKPGKFRQQLSAEARYGLIMQSGPLAGHVIVIERPILRIGRRSTNDVVIPDPTVSRQHARLFQARNGLVLIDENSCNGTFVNGCRITNSTVLRPDDIVRFGTSHCRVWRIPPRQDATQRSVVVPSGAGIVAGRVPAEGEDVTRYPVAVPSAAGRDTLCIAARIALVDSVQRLHEAERHAINV